jgi:4-amino-4-deoxy-L-arabinose transferase-like glycosyltransferase
MQGQPRSFSRDGFFVAIYCLILFGFAGFSGRPLTMHEARLPETSREMLARHDWLLPTSGGRPWLERPPLPHWIVISTMKLFGRVDRVWIVRLPSAVMGTITVLFTMYIAGKWFDPITGIVSACVLATAIKFYQYATLAEDDIYLAALVAGAIALFTRAELWSAKTTPALRYSEEPGASANGPGSSEYLRTGVGQLVVGFFTLRPWPVMGFFVILGIANLTRGPLLAIIYGGCPVAVYALICAWMQKSLAPISRYTWLWGWIALIALALAWPLYAMHVHPDVVDNWKYDYVGRINGVYAAINEPWWFYVFKALPLALLPWTPICLVGVYVSTTSIWRAIVTRASGPCELHGSNKTLDKPMPPARAGGPCHGDAFSHLWVLCWAIVPLLILSIPKGKHDHYLVPFLAPWAILGSIGLVEIYRLIETRTDFPLAASEQPTLISAMVLLLVGYCIGEAKLAARTDHTIDDTAFLIRCRDEATANLPLFIDAKLGPPGNLDFFRVQFYSRNDAHLLHNLSFLRDERITAPTVMVICRSNDRYQLDQMGSTQLIDQSKKSHEQDDFFGPLSLYRLTFRTDLVRYPLPTVISSLQAMERAPGPWCGPAPIK